MELLYWISDVSTTYHLRNANEMIFNVNNNGNDRPTALIQMHTFEVHFSPIAAQLKEIHPAPF